MCAKSARVKCFHACDARTYLVRACDITRVCKHARVSARMPTLAKWGKIKRSTTLSTIKC